jgi:Ca2+-binding RTX toxin-like protein
VTVTLASSAAQNTVNAGLDTLTSIENLTGSSFNDALTGNTGANLLQGGVGNDTLNGGLGNDSLDGGLGTDTASYAGATAGVTVTLASSAAQNTVNAGLDTLISIENLTGSSFNDALTGNTGANLLQGGVGNDTLNGGLGNDSLDGGTGTDTASYAGATAGVTVTLATPGVAQNTINAGTDTLTSIENLTGSSFNDTLTGDAGANVLDGGLGDDTLNGGGGADSLIGGDGNDNYLVDQLGDVVSETNAAAAGGNDLVTSEIDYSLGANVENLQLTGAAVTGIGNSLDNRITGSTGNNTLQGGLGNDSLDGGLGTDTASYAGATAGVTVTLATPGVAQNTVNAGTDTLTSIENLVGSDFNDTLTGDAGANKLEGGVGNDTLNGGAGNDSLDGGAGTDTASYAGTAAGVTVTLASSAAQNTVNAGLDTLSGIENLTGSSFNDALTGNTGANLLQGGVGNDTLNGGLGNDTLDGGTGHRHRQLRRHRSRRDRHPGDQPRRRTPSTPALDTLTSIENLTGSSFNDTLTGNTGANLLQGGVGNDTLNGGLGNDSLDGGAGTDTASYAGATAGVTVTLATPGVAQNTVNAGTDTLSSIENLTGSSFNDTLTGDAGNNILDGAAGNDTLDGGAGSDTVDGGSGDDRGIYRPSAAGVGDADTYKGNVGSDTLSLELTHAELNSAEVQADLRAYEEFLRLNANAAVATGAEFQFTAFALKASGWEHLEVTDTDGMIWRNGTAGVTIGSAAAQTSFDIGTNAGPPTGDIWTGALPSGNDNWSIPDNWQDISVPTPADTVVFNATDPGGRSVVDPAFQGAIAGLVDTGEAAHTVEYQRALQVNGPASIYTANEQNTGALTILNTQVTLHLTDLNVGINAIGSGTANGYLLLNSGAVVDATDVGGVSVGTAVGGNAYGAIRLAANSTFNLGTVEEPADLNIGWNYGSTATSLGVLDALNPTANVNWHLNQMLIGRSTNGAGTATGTLRWNQTEAILATYGVFFAYGGGTKAVLDVPTGGTLLLGTAAAPIGYLDIAENNTGGAKTSANLDFSLTNPTFTAHVGTELRVGSSYRDEAEGTLKLASNSTLNVGTAAALAVINIGWNYSDYYSASAVGVLDALNPAANVNWHLNQLFVGHTSHGIGTGTGTLRWNQTEAILVSEGVYFALGGGATAVLDVPAGGTLLLGTAAAPIVYLDIAENNTGGAKTSANLDFSLTNPTFTAHVGTELRVGSSNRDEAEGTLKLASNSTLNVGTAAALAVINIGWNYSDYYSASAVGVLDALNPAANVNWHLNQLFVGHTSHGIGTGTGTLRWNQTEAILVSEGVYFALGGGATAVLDVPAGGTLLLGTAAAPIGYLDIAENNTGGAKTSANLDFSLTNPTFTAHVGTELRVGSSYRDEAEGTLKLASNSTLNVGNTVNIGWNYSDYYSASAVGVLDALNPAANVNWHLNQLFVGHTSHGIGTGTGTLRWNQTEAILVSEGVYFALGGGATAVLDVPAGGTLLLGTAAAPIGYLDIAENNTGGAKTSANLDFSLTNPTFTAHVGTELRVGSSYRDEAEGTLKLASNSTLNVGNTVNIGWNYSDYYSASAVGVLDALNPAANVNWHLNQLFVGHTSHGIGTGTGTLRWNQTEAILVSEGVYFALGGGATAVLDVPAGGTLLLGTAAAPIGYLDIAENNTGGAKTSANLDFSLTNPTFTAHVGTELRVGSSYRDEAEGTLKLASNSTLNVGTAAALADINIGWNYSDYYGASAVGVLDALNPAAVVNWHLNQLFVGRTNHGIGTGTGTLLMGEGVTSDANAVLIGSGPGATGLLDIVGGSMKATTLTLASGTLDLNANPLTIGATGTLNAQTLDLTGGLLTGQTLSITDGTFNFSGGVVSVDTFTGLLDQNGGVLAPGNSVGQTTVNGNYDLASAGTVKIEIFGSTFNTTTKLYDRLAVNGTVNLNGDSNVGGGGTLDVDLGYSPTVGSSFTVVANDGTDAVSGRFKGLLEGATFTSAYGSQTVTFQISYSGGTGNDIVLTVTGKTGVAPTGLTVDGTADNDLLSGSVGADTFTGLAGNDIFTGGAGNDLFVFDVGCGFDRINDFSPGGDDIQLSLALAANFAALDSNGNSVLDDADASVIVAGSDTILLFGSDQIDIVGQSALHSTDFVFV